MGDLRVHRVRTRAARAGLRASAVVLAAGVAAAASAHVPETVSPAAPSLAWNGEPAVVLPLVASALLYAFGTRRAWRAAGPGRGVAGRQATAFAVGWALLAAALVSPLDALGAGLFSAHMVQHELMMVGAAPLLCLGRPLVAAWWALPPRWRPAWRRVFSAPGWARPWAAIASIGGGWAAHALVLWAWHWPPAFERALASDAWHAAQHASFLFSALLFWWPLVDRRRASSGASLASLFTTMLHTAALGALLALSAQPWYPAYAARAAAWGWDAMEDQQLGGLVMWAPAGMAYVAAGLALVARLIRVSRPRGAARASSG